MVSKIKALLMLVLLPLLLLFSRLNSSHGCPIVTYWGQNTNGGDLFAACHTRKYEIINIAFMNHFGGGRTPKLDLTGHCDHWSTNIPNCTKFASQIAYCQRKGVKIFLSLGGTYGEYNLSSPQDAKKVANYLWTYYLSGQRPGHLGLVALDGIDFDIQRAGGTLYWDDLAKELHAYTQIKKFYLSAAPQCSIQYYMDAAIKTGLFDYIWVQFYDNPTCEYTSDDGGARKLKTSRNRWTTNFTTTKFYVGLSATPPMDGYVPMDKLNSEILPKLETSPKFGGGYVME